VLSEVKLEKGVGNKLEQLCAAVRVCSVRVARVSHAAGAFSPNCVDRQLARLAKEIP